MTWGMTSLAEHEELQRQCEAAEALAADRLRVIADLEEHLAETLRERDEARAQ